MKKIIVLLAVLFSANAFAASNQSINLATQVTGTLGVANGGTGQVGGLVFNSTGAASANTTAIQAALTAGGHVTIDCPAGSVVYISSTLTYYSNSIIEIPCTVRAVAGTGAMMQNYAATQSPTTLYDNSGLIASGPLSVIWSGSTPAWVVSTAYTQGKYAVANSNLYWESASSCTSAGSGSGPSGTGTGITDGTCSWNYVTTSIPNPNSGNQTVAIHWPSHGLSVGQKIFITPQPDGSTYGNYWSGTQSAHTRGGLADSAYFGVFPVLNVNDSNYITVALRRAPQVAFSGIPMNIKVADQNVTIGGGGTLDYNYTVNTGNTGAISSHAVVASGISNFKVSKAGLNIVNAQKYDLCLCSGVSDIDIGNFNTGSSGSPSDRIKVYGPAFNVNIHDSNGANGDDIVSFQTEETTSFYQYILGAGDIINGIIATKTRRHKQGD